MATTIWKQIQKNKTQLRLALGFPLTLSATCKVHNDLGILKMAGVKGRSGTNKGKYKHWADALRVAVMRPSADGRTHLAMIADRCVEAALGGDMQAIREIGDRLDGKPKQALDVAHPPKPLREYTDAELTAIIARGVSSGDGRDDEPEANPELLN